MNQSSVKLRARYRLRPLRGKTLSETHPSLVREWHRSRNKPLTPHDVSRWDGIEVYWMCATSKKHVWKEKIIYRTTKKKPVCPKCYSLASIYPKIAKEWHPTKNEFLIPWDVRPQSNQRAWWKCDNSPKHEWESTIYDRVRKDTRRSSCPYCGNKRVTVDNCLATRFPDIVSEWNDERNYPKTPSDFVPGSDFKAHWICSKCNEKYRSYIYSRKAGHGCTFCSNQAVSKQNNLGVLHKEIAEEWHPTRNKGKKPSDFVPGSTFKAWWVCKRKHRPWRTEIRVRVKGFGCPVCSGHSSKPEQILYRVLSKIFQRVKNGYKLDGYEVDVYVPKIDTVIEYDGWYYHRKSRSRIDREKIKRLKKKHRMIIRVRELPLKSCSEDDLLCNGKIDKETMNGVFSRILTLKNLPSGLRRRIKAFLASKDLGVRENTVFKKVPLHRSLFRRSKRLNREWYKEKNLPLTPRNVSLFSNLKVWWICKRKHDWEAFISSRARGSNCPYCSGRNASREYNLALVNVKLAKLWHPKLNRPLTPYSVLPMSNKKVWWFCKACESEFEASINNMARKDRCLRCKQ